MNCDNKIEEIAYVVRNTVEAVYFGVDHVSFDSADILRNFCEPICEGKGLFPKWPNEIEPEEVDKIRLHLIAVIAHAAKLLLECPKDVQK